jgi:hypothetical protein
MVAGNRYNYSEYIYGLIRRTSFGLILLNPLTKLDLHIKISIKVICELSTRGFNDQIS